MPYEQEVNDLLEGAGRNLDSCGRMVIREYINSLHEELIELKTTLGDLDT